MKDEDLIRMLGGLVKLTPEEAGGPKSKPMYKKDGNQAPDPNSNTSLKKERNRLAARTPAQVRRDEILEERKRLKKKAETVNLDAIVYRIDHGKKDIRRHAAEVKATQEKRARRSRPKT